MCHPTEKHAGTLACPSKCCVSIWPVYIVSHHFPKIQEIDIQSGHLSHFLLPVFLFLYRVHAYLVMSSLKVHCNLELAGGSRGYAMLYAHMRPGLHFFRCVYRNRRSCACQPALHLR